MNTIIMVSGLLAFLSLILTAAIGLMVFKFHVRWAKIKWHIWFAGLTVIFAIIHVLAVLYSRML